MNKASTHSNVRTMGLALLTALLTASAVMAQTPAFTYQGKLSDTGSAASGNYDFQFKLFNTATLGTGTQFGSMVPVSNVTVANGIFTVQLDFSPCANCLMARRDFLKSPSSQRVVPRSIRLVHASLLLQILMRFEV